MRILITNDDGIKSPVLPMLAKWASKHGEVTVIAPKTEQSAKSHAIDFTRPIEIKQVIIGEGIEAYSVDSTPADCVRYAYLGLGMRPDIVISGVNRGYNLGRDIVYSGTCGAIFEAARLGLRGVALSTDTHGFENAINSLDALYELFKEKDLLEKNGLYNVNIPTVGSEIEFTHLGRIYFTDEFVPVGNDMYVQEGEPQKYGTPDPGSDIDAINAGRISVTPLFSDRTNRELLEELK